MKRLIIVCVGVLSASPGHVAAQAAPAGPAAGEVVGQGSLRVRGEGWNWFGEEDGGKYAYVGSLTRLGAGQQWESIGWSLEMARPALIGLPDDAVAAAPRGQLGVGPSYRAANDDESTTAGIFLKQGFLRVGSVPGRPGHGARLGRFEFAEGTEVAPANATIAAVKRDRVAHRLLGNFGWSHVGRSLDGGHYGYTAPRWNATAVVARPTQGVFDVDGWGGLDVGVAYGAATLRDRADLLGEGRLFVLHYLDRRDLVEVDNRPLAARQADSAELDVTTFGGHYIGLVGGADLMLWGAGQVGGWGSLDQRGWAGAAELGYQPGEVGGLRPWLRVGHFRSSGDSDPTDGTHETFFQVLPTPRIYARTPFFHLMNLTETFGSVVLRPSSRVTVRGDVRVLGLSASQDLWYAGGGAFETDTFGYGGRPSGGGSSLARLFDLSVDLRATSALTVTGYAGVADGGEVVEGIYGAGEAGFGYVEVEYRW